MQGLLLYLASVAVLTVVVGLPALLYWDRARGN